MNLNEPYWLSKYNTYPSKNANKCSYDVIILGGGLRGIATLFWLLPYKLNMAYVSPTILPYGGTVRNLGDIHALPNGDLSKFDEQEVKDRIALSSHNISLINNLTKFMEITCEIIQNGSIHIATDSATLKLIKNNQKFDASCTSLDSKEVCSMTGASNLYGGLYYPQDISINPYLLSDLILRSTLEYDHAFTLSGMGIIAIQEKDDHVELMTANGTKLTCNFLVVSDLNYYSRLVQDDEKALKDLVNIAQQSYNFATIDIEELEEVPSIPCRTIDGNHSWNIDKSKFLYSMKGAKPGTFLDYINIQDANIMGAASFLLDCFPDKKDILQREYTWTDNYIQSDSLLPSVEMFRDSEKIIVNALCDHDWMDTFFVVGKSIAEFIGEGSPLLDIPGGEDV